MVGAGRLRHRVPGLWLTDCLAYPAAMNDKPCLVEHMALPASKLRLLATYPGSARTGSLTLTWFGQECGGELWCGSGVYSVVIGASNAYGTSVYAIVDSARVCWQCTY